MQFLIGFDRFLRTGSISTIAVTMFRDHSQKAWSLKCINIF